MLEILDTLDKHSEGMADLSLWKVTGFLWNSHAGMAVVGAATGGVVGSNELLDLDRGVEAVRP